MPFNDDELRELISQGATDEEIATLQAKRDSKPGFWSEAGEVIKGIPSGIAKLMTLPRTGIELAAGGIRSGLGLPPMKKEDKPLSLEMFPSMQDANTFLDYTGLNPEPQTATGRFVTPIVEAAAAAPFFPGSAAQNMVIGVASETTGQIADRLGAGPVLGTAARVAGGGVAAGGIAIKQGMANAAEKGIEYLSNPSVQAALKYVKGRGIITPQMEKDLAAGKVTKEIQDAVNAAQQEVQYLKRTEVNSSGESVVKDDLWARAFGQPQSNSQGRPLAMANELSKEGENLSRMGAGQGSQYNWLTNQFEGPPPQNINEVLPSIQTAQNQILERRNTIIKDVDSAMADINKRHSYETAARGIQDTDIESKLGPLRDLIARRESLAQTMPEAQEMKSAITKVRSSFARLFPKNQAPLISQSLIRGEATPSQVHNFIVDINAYRRALGEFDQAAQASGALGDFASTQSRNAELYALSQIQDALSTTLNSKIDEILAVAPQYLETRSFMTVPPSRTFGSWSQMKQFVTGGKLERLNNDFKSLATLEQNFVPYLNTTVRGTVNPEQSRFITAQNNLNQQIAQDVPTSTTGALRSVARWLFKPTEGNPALQSMQRNLQRYTSPLEELLAAETMRTRRVPTLPRNWDSIKENVDNLTELSGRAFALSNMGALQNIMLPDPEAFKTLPEHLQKSLFEQIMGLEMFTTQPNVNMGGFEPVPGNYTSAQKENDQWILKSPIEKDYVLDNAMKEKDPAKRALKAGPLLSDGIYTPDEDLQLPTSPKPRSTDPLAPFQGLSSTPSPQTTPSFIPAQSDSQLMLQQMQQATQNHGY